MKLFLFMAALGIIAGCMGCDRNSPSSKYVIAYSSDESGSQDIYLTDVSGTSKIKITDYKGMEGDPAWSPDGKSIAFFAAHGEKTWSIYTMAADGSNRKRLTRAENRWDSSPAWSPDGKKITFTREYDRSIELWTMNSDGSDLHQIRALEGGGACYAPDGKIVFHSKYHDSEICIADPDGGNVVELTINNAEDWYPEISPDGKQIAFMSDRDEKYCIYLMNIDGRGQRRLTRSKRNEWFPCWSPGGKEIVFASDRDGDLDIYIMKADGSEVRNITNDDAKSQHPSWLRIRK